MPYMLADWPNVERGSGLMWCPEWGKEKGFSSQYMYTGISKRDPGNFLKQKTDLMIGIKPSLEDVTYFGN
jgi:hypothetical protein